MYRFFSLPHFLSRRSNSYITKSARAAPDAVPQCVLDDEQVTGVLRLLVAPPSVPFAR